MSLLKNKLKQSKRKSLWALEAQAFSCSLSQVINKTDYVNAFRITVTSGTTLH